jgi:hypothetical protein
MVSAAAPSASRSPHRERGRRRSHRREEAGSIRNEDEDELGTDGDRIVPGCLRVESAVRGRQAREVVDRYHEGEDRRPNESACRGR